MALRSAVVLKVLLISLIFITPQVKSLKCYVDKIPRVETCNDVSTPQYCSCHLSNWTGTSFKSTGCSELVYHNYDFSRGLVCVDRPGSEGLYHFTYVRQCFCDEDLCCTQDTLNNAKNVRIGPFGSGVSITPTKITVVLVMIAFKILSQVAS